MQRSLLHKHVRIPDEHRRGQLAQVEPMFLKDERQSAPPLTFLEYCCGENSQIAKQARTLLKDCKVLRKTEKTDMREQNHLDQAMLEVQRAPYGSLLLWCSIRCTGGSNYQVQNRARWTQRGQHDKLAENDAKVDKARHLWHNFTTLADQACTRGHTVAIEWPATCSYWQFPEVAEYLNGKIVNNLDDSLESIVTHGCMWGVVNSDGEPTLKPWKFTMFGHDDLSIQSFLYSLFVQCDGSHLKQNRYGAWVHGESHGADLKASEHYPEKLAKSIV